jgi:guanine deaminase
MTTIVRAKIAHTPRNPFVSGGGLEAFEEGALAFEGGRVLACGDARGVLASHPDATVRDARNSILLPGFVDCHVHYPQIGVIGAMGLELLDWLRMAALPEEVRLGDEGYARSVASAFVRGLAANGTTTALVFGSHFPAAQEALFSAAEASGLRIASGLVVSDRGLVPELHSSVEEAVAASRMLISRWHGRGLLRYAVTPRFSVSCSEAMLAACGELMRDGSGLLFTSHLNETVGEVALVRELFPRADDYLATYEDVGLAGPRSVFAHDVHVTDSELARLARAGTAVAHCPSSNAFLGSGLFPFARHQSSGVRVALGTDVGAGTSLSMLGEALAAYQLQRVNRQPVLLSPAELLWLATAAGADALGLEEETGDLRPGKSADFVLIRPRAGSTLATVLERADSIDEILGALFTLAREESVVEVRVAGELVWPVS